MSWLTKNTSAPEPIAADNNNLEADIIAKIIAQIDRGQSKESIMRILTFIADYTANTRTLYLVRKERDR